MALSDVYEVRWTGTIFAETCNLVFHALRTGTSFLAADVAQASWDSLGDTILPVSTAELIWTQISARNIGDPTDFTELSLGTTGGTHAGSAFSPYASFTIRFPRKRSDMHHGYKRIPGVAEASVTNGRIESVDVTRLNALGADIIDGWFKSSAPGTDVCNYIVVKRILKPNGTYRLPETDGELVYYQPTAYNVLSRVTTQNSRRFRA